MPGWYATRIPDRNTRDLHNQGGLPLATIQGPPYNPPNEGVHFTFA